MTISKALLDELLSGVERPEDLLGDKRRMKELKVRLMERMLGAELTEHLGYEPHGEPASQQSNRRNGAARKVLKGNDGAVPIDIPRDRDGSFEPELIGRVASITGQARSTLTRENGQPTDSNLAQPSSVILLRARTPICASVF